MPPKTETSSSQPDISGSLTVTLGTFLACLAGRLNRLNDASVEPITLRAIPLPPPANRKVYNGRVYCGLRDTTGSAQFHLLASAFSATVCLPQKANLTDSILNLHRAGKREAEIVRELEVSRWVVRRVIRKAGRDPASPG